MPHDDIEVLTFGEALAVFIAEPGVPLSAATSYRRSVAGAELNLAIGLSRLGHRVGWAGRVGDDNHGRLVVRTLRAEGVDTSDVSVDPDASTGLMIRDVMLDRAIEVTYFRSQSAGSRLEPLDVDRIRSSRVLAVSGVTAALSSSALDVTLAAVQAAREAGVSVVFDPNIRLKVARLEAQLDGLRQLCKHADIVLSGEDEALAISGRERADEGLGDWFLGQGCETVAFKAGARGAWAMDTSELVRQAAYPVRAADPVGAGDAFAAGFISTVLRDGTLAEAVERGAACGALNVSVVGDFDGSPTEAELQRFLAGGHDVHR